MGGCLEARLHPRVIRGRRRGFYPWWKGGQRGLTGGGRTGFFFFFFHSLHFRRLSEGDISGRGEERTRRRKSEGCASFFTTTRRSNEGYTQSTNEARFLKEKGKKQMQKRKQPGRQGGREGDAGSFYFFSLILLHVFRHGEKDKTRGRQIQNLDRRGAADMLGGFKTAVFARGRGR